MTDNDISNDISIMAATEDIEAQLSRIAAALERIADRLDYLGEDGVLNTEVR